MIALVTETLCCMDPSDCAAYGVHLIPLSCALGEETLLDRLLLREESMAGVVCMVWDLRAKALR